MVRKTRGGGNYANKYGITSTQLVFILLIVLQYQ